MYNPFDRSAKTAPSHYPRLAFHTIRTFQLLSSFIVGGIMLYFIWHLTHDHWKTPWTFIWLTSASLFSIAALTCTVVLHCCIGLNPRLNLAANSFLTILWGLSWSLLTWYMSGTLSNFCDIEHWNEDIGIMVCRIYKTLFTFTLLGLLSTVAALSLDIYVRRQQTRSGIYQLHELGKEGQTADRRPFADENTPYSNGLTDQRRESGAWDTPGRISIGPYSESSDEKIQQQGYTLPENQFEYDTGYHGAHAITHQDERLYG